jgi:hypothetical protein
MDGCAGCKAQHAEAWSVSEKVMSGADASSRRRTSLDAAAWGGSNRHRSRQPSIAARSSASERRQRETDPTPSPRYVMTPVLWPSRTKPYATSSATESNAARHAPRSAVPVASRTSLSRWAE